MQLILAIDGDPRRSEQLASLVRARLTVDLVQATSAGEGLHVLKDRVPDLILTAPLLSPFDDGVLDEYLRDLGAAGAHVQTLRIPVLTAPPRKQAFAKTLFSLGRTERESTSAAVPDGCDPKIFADEIALYLSRAADARKTLAHLAQASPRQDEAQPSPVVAQTRPVISYPTVMSEAIIEEFADAVEPSYAELAEPRYVEVAEPPYVEATEPRYVEATETSHDIVNDSTHIGATELSSVEHRRNTATLFVDTTPDADQRPAPDASPKGPRTSATFDAALAAIRAAWVKTDVPARDSSLVVKLDDAAAVEEAPHRKTVTTRVISIT